MQNRQQNFQFHIGSQVMATMFAAYALRGVRNFDDLYHTRVTALSIAILIYIIPYV